MAKAKKSKATEKSDSGEGAAKDAKSAAPIAKPAAPAAPAVPMIDTNLAASTAAKLIARKDERGAAASSGSGESAAFKQLKENMHRPVGGTVPSFLQDVAPSKKFNNSVPNRNKQVGHNQTFGADVNRTGVPRRTGG